MITISVWGFCAALFGAYVFGEFACLTMFLFAHFLGETSEPPQPLGQAVGAPGSVAVGTAEVLPVPICDADGVVREGYFASAIMQTLQEEQPK